MDARTASVSRFRTLRPYWWHVVTTERIRSTKRLPSALWAPKHGLRQITAGPSSRLAALLVGSTLGWVTNVQSASHQVSNSWLKAVTFYHVRVFLPRSGASVFHGRADGRLDRLHGGLQPRPRGGAVAEGVPGGEHGFDWVNRLHARGLSRIPPSASARMLRVRCAMQSWRCAAGERLYVL